MGHQLFKLLEYRKKIFAVVVLTALQAFIDILTVMFVGYSLSAYVNGMDALSHITFLAIVQQNISILGSFDGLLKLSILLIFLRAISSIATNFLSLTVCSSIGKAMRRKILLGYLNLDYSIVTTIPASDLQRNIVDLVNLYVGKIVQPMLKVLSDFLIVLGLLFVMWLSSDATIFLSLSLLIFLIVFVDRVLKKMHEINGAINIRAIGLVHALVKDVIKFGAEIRIAKYRDYIMSRAEHGSSLFASSWRNSVFWVGCSRLILETLSYLFLIFLLWYVSSNDIPSASIVGMLVIFARAVPVFNSIATNAALLRGGLPVARELAKLKSELLHRSNSDLDQRDFSCGNIALSVRKLVYGIDKPLNKEPITFEVHFGEILGIIGPSGSGKTTLIEVLTNLRRPKSGSVEIPKFSKISISTQSGHILNDTFRANLDPNNKSNDSELYEQLTSFKLESVLERYTLDSSHIMNENELSGGQLQRVNLLRSLIQPKDIWVLDEPTSSLDHHTRNQVMTIILDQASKGVAIVLVTHDEKLMEICHKTIRLGDSNV